MRGRWDIIAPVTAGIAVLVLVVMPDGRGTDLEPVLLQVRQTALETAAPGSAVPWTAPQSGLAGTIIPAAVFDRGDGSLCRRYQVVISGQPRQETACRDELGVWRGTIATAQTASLWGSLFGAPDPVAGSQLAEAR